METEDKVGQKNDIGTEEHGEPVVENVSVAGANGSSDVDSGSNLSVSPAILALRNHLSKWYKDQREIGE